MVVTAQGCPEVDLVVRTSGETRLSDFLLLQSRWAALHFTATLWPDFSFADLLAAVAQYQREAPAIVRLRAAAGGAPGHTTPVPAPGPVSPSAADATPQTAQLTAGYAEATDQQQQASSRSAPLQEGSGLGGNGGRRRVLHQRAPAALCASVTEGAPHGASDKQSPAAANVPSSVRPTIGAGAVARQALQLLRERQGKGCGAGLPPGRVELLATSR